MGLTLPDRHGLIVDTMLKVMDNHRMAFPPHIIPGTLLLLELQASVLVFPLHPLPTSKAVQDEEEIWSGRDSVVTILKVRVRGVVITKEDIYLYM